MPNIIKTLDDIIKRSDRFDMNKISFFATTDDGTLVILDQTLFDIYMRYVYPAVETFSVNHAQREYYKFKPYLLSLDLYGTPSLGWLLLKLNDRECASKFYLKSTVRFITAQHMDRVHELVSTKSTKRMKQNWNTHLKRVGEYLG